MLATNPWGLCVRLNFCKVGKCRNLNTLFPCIFPSSFRLFPSVLPWNLEANFSDFTLSNKIAVISLQCYIYMPMLFTIIIPVSYIWTQYVAIVPQWSAGSVLFAFLILLESLWTLHPNFSLSRGDSSGRSRNISDPGLSVFMELSECLDSWHNWHS